MYAQAMGLALHTRRAAGRFEVLVLPLA
jgi:hypothetical protein